jgi:hypothetical protein
MMMRETEAAAAAKDLTFGQAWAMLRENDRQIRELSREAGRRQAETSQQIRELSKSIGGVDNAFGRWAEEMISARLWEKFKTIGYTFTRGGPVRFWEGAGTVVQVDMLLENGDYAMPVEIKSMLTAEDVDDHIERIGRVREELDKYGDRKKLVGAVAGMAVPGKVREYAQRKGLYVLVRSGDSVALAEAPGVFKVREW